MLVSTNSLDATFNSFFTSLLNVFPPAFLILFLLDVKKSLAEFFMVRIALYVSVYPIIPVPPEKAENNAEVTIPEAITAMFSPLIMLFVILSATLNPMSIKRLAPGRAAHNAPDKAPATPDTIDFNSLFSSFLGVDK